MKTILKISFLLLLPFLAKAQTLQKTADSLRQALRMAVSDSSRFDIAQKLGYFYYDSNADSMLHYIEILCSLAEKNNMMLDLANSFVGKASQFYRLGRFGESFKYLLQAAKILEDPASEKKTFASGKQADLRKKRLSLLGNAHLVWGNLLGGVTDTSGQLFHYLKAKELCTDGPYSSLLPGINMSIGKVYYDLGKTDSALHWAQTALEILLKPGIDKTYIGEVYRFIGNICLKKGDKKQALENWHRGVSPGKNTNNLRYLAGIYGTLASFYFDEKSKDSGLYYAKKQLAVLQLMESSDLGPAYSNLYKSFELNGNKDSAYIYKGLALEATEKALKERIKNLGDFQKEAFQEQERLRQLEQEKTESKNKLRSFALLGVLAVSLVVGLLLYRNNLHKQRANKILQEQKDKVESTLQELKSIQYQLIQSEKMASLGELTAGIAHEIQNPLNFVNNFSEVNRELLAEMKKEIAKGNYDEATALAKDIEANEEKINHHGKRADSIVKGMLQHSRGSTGQKEPVDINNLLDECLRLSFHGMRAKDKSFNVKTETSFDKSLSPVNLVSQDIGRVFLNLFTNAFYSVMQKNKTAVPPPEGGIQYEPSVSVSTQKLENAIVIKITDNGNGIPQKVIDKIFQPFFTTKPTGEGTGLGLSMSYDIITKGHGGELKVETKEGEFARFIIILPI